MSGIWFFVESFFLVRSRITVSLNSALDIVKVVKKKSDEESTNREGVQSMEKEQISKMEQLLASLSKLPKSDSFLKRIFYGDPQLAFEIAVPSNSEQINFYVSFPKKFQRIVEKQIHSFFPDSFIERVEDYTIFEPDSFTAGSQIKLEKKEAFPIRTYQQLEFDPLHNITNVLSKLDHSTEGAAIQLVVKRAGKSWFNNSEKIARRMQQGIRLEKASQNNILINLLSSFGGEIYRMITGAKDEDQQRHFDLERTNNPFQLTPEEQEVIKQLESKYNKVRFKTNIRIISSAKTKEKADEIVTEMENAFVQFDDVNLNKLSSRRKKGRNLKKLCYDFIFRNFSKSGSFMLSTEELVSIFHFPIATTETPNINWLKAKSAPPPIQIPKEGLLLGYSDFRGTKTDIRLSDNDRRRHLYIIGQTGVGKSTFIEEMAK